MRNKAVQITPQHSLIIIRGAEYDLCRIVTLVCRRYCSRRCQRRVAGAQRTDHAPILLHTALTSSCSANTKHITPIIYRRHCAMSLAVFMTTSEVASCFVPTSNRFSCVGKRADCMGNQPHNGPNNPTQPRRQPLQLFCYQRQQQILRRLC